MPLEALQRSGMKASYQTVAVALGLVVVAWVGCFSHGLPTLICPLPTITVIPAFFLGSPPWHLPYRLAILVPAVLFLAWSPGLVRGNAGVPKRSWVLLIVLTALSVVYFIGSWKFGMQFQGREYTLAICALNVAWIVALWGILYYSARLYSFRSNLLFHAALFTWLAWHAFPYLGELP